MKKIYKLFWILAFTVAFGQMAQAQTQVTVSGADAASNGSYTTLKAAFDAINVQTQTGYNIVVQISASTTETASARLTEGAWATLTIYPTATGCSISGILDAVPLVDLDGADNVTIDGRVNLTGSDQGLTISNGSTSNVDGTSTVQFINGACSNSIKYCYLLGSSQGLGHSDHMNGAMVVFNTSTSSTGNNYNIIENNRLTHAENGLPTCVCTSTSSSGKNNTGIIIRNNLFYDYLDPNATSYGILMSGFTNLTISGNSFYHTTAFSSNQGGTVYPSLTAIFTANGSGVVISRNYIGGTAPQCGGGYMTKTGGNVQFRGICTNNSSFTPIASIQGNVIRNISWTNDLNAPFYAMQLRGGTVYIGTEEGNIIGSPTGTNSIVFTSGAEAIFYAIGDQYNAKLNVQNNIIGGITTACSNSDYACNFKGIYQSSGKGGNPFTCIGNQIGSLVTPNSIVASSSSSTQKQHVYGIHSSIIYASGTISGNTIANLTNATTCADPAVRGVINGIIHDSKNSNIAISGNTVRDLMISNTNDANDYTSSATGIICRNIISSGAATITNNTVYNITNNNPGFSGQVKGMNLSYYISEVSGNMIYGLSVNPAATGATIIGMNDQSEYSSYKNFNNIISLGGNTATTIYGIYENYTYDNVKCYFNTIVISGTAPAGSLNQSRAFYNSANTSYVSDFRNNLLVNTRSTPGGSSLHYAAYFDYTHNTNLTLDYNDYYVTGEGGVIGYWDGADRTSLPIVTDNDAHSLTINPVMANAGGTLAADYMPAATLAGVNGTTITTDFASTTRPDPPTMGAWEQRFEMSWTGSAGTTDWNSAGNWNTAAIPTRYSDVTIPSAPAYQPVVNQAPATPAICNNLTVATGASLQVAAGKALTVYGTLANNGGNNGLVLQSDATGAGSLVHYSDNVPATVKTFITGSSNLEALKYHFMSLPVQYTSPTAGLFQGSYLYELDPTALLSANNYGVWDPVGSSYSAPLNTNKGYMAYYPDASTTYTFSGNLNNGNYTYSLTGHAGTGVYTFNLIPNPYPSAINWKTGTGWARSQGIGGSCYVWSAEAGNYVTLSSVSDNYIPVGQACMVVVSDEASPLLSINNSARAHNEQAFYKSGNSLLNQLSIKAVANNFSDVTTVAFTEGATDGFDLPLDGFKIYGLDKAPQLYTVSGDKKYSLNNLPLFTDQQIVEMNFETKFTGNVTLNFEGIESFDPSLNIYLRDELTSQTINLRNQQVYNFIHNTGNAASRFKLVFGGTIGIEENGNQSGNMWIAGNTLYISAPKLIGQTGLVEVYNAAGQKLMSRTILLDNLSTMELNVKGFVIVKVTTGQAVLSSKGIITK